MKGAAGEPYRDGPQHPPESEYDRAPLFPQRGASEAAGDGLGLRRDSSALRAMLLHHAGIVQTTAMALAAGVSISEAWHRVLAHSADRLREIAGGAR